MSKEHKYQTQLTWTGNQGSGTQSYKTYERSYSVSINGKSDIQGSSDPNFRGDSSKHNPEEMLVMSLSSCHMLWYLHLCSVNSIVVEHYIDCAEGTMNENNDGSGQFKEVILSPDIVISSGDLALAHSLHEKAHHMCFIARSVNFPVHCKSIIKVKD